MAFSAASSSKNVFWARLSPSICLTRATDIHLATYVIQLSLLFSLILFFEVELQTERAEVPWTDDGRLSRFVRGLR